MLSFIHIRAIILFEKCFWGLGFLMQHSFFGKKVLKIVFGNFKNYIWHVHLTQNVSKTCPEVTKNLYQHVKNICLGTF